MTLTAQEFANLLNLDPRRVQQLAKEGVIEKEGRGKYPLSEATSYIRYLQELVQQRKIKDESPGALDAEQQRARKDKEGADKLALENALTRKELVLAEEVDKMNADVDLLVKSGFLTLAAKVAQRVAGESDERKCQNILDAAIRKVLEDLS